MRRGVRGPRAHAFVTDMTSATGAAQRARARCRGSCCSRSRRPTSPTRPSPSAPPGRSTSGSPGCCACASPISASWATSCTSRPSRPSHVYDRLVEAGAAVGLRHAGLKALASLRMEKGYRDYGHDIDNTDSVHRGRSRVLRRLSTSRAGFVGRDAVAAAKAAGPPTRRLVQVLVTDPDPLLFHAEVVHRDGAARRLRPGRVLRPHPRRRGRPGHGGERGRPARRPGLAGRRDVGGRHRRPPLPRHRLDPPALRPGHEARPRRSPPSRHRCRAGSAPDRRSGRHGRASDVVGGRGARSGSAGPDPSRPPGRP